jgi:glycosyltransferase involved in cell wall biosynthesis
MAYNEEAYIERTIRAVLQQQGPSVRIDEVIIVASGCTDRTVPIVATIALQEPRVRLYVQEKREGKASAINLFLKEAISPLDILVGADVIPEASALFSQLGYELIYEPACIVYNKGSLTFASQMKNGRMDVSTF